MRYIKSISSVSLIVFFILLFAFTYSNKAQIVSMEGKVLVMPSGTTGWISAKVGMQLKRGDKIKTGPNAECNLAFDRKRKNIIGILKNSEVIILLKKDEKIEIIDASLYAILMNIPASSSFELRTPVAVCGARGTGLGLIANHENTQASAFRNNIYIRNRVGEEKTIREGFKRIVDGTGKISSEAAVKAEAVKRFNKWLNSMAGLRRSGISQRSAVSVNVEESVEESTKQLEKTIEKVLQKRQDDRSEKVGSGGGDQY